MDELLHNEFSEAAERVVGETHRQPKERITLKNGDTALINRYIERYEDVMGGEEIARFALGGHGSEEHNNKPAMVALINVWNKENSDYVRLMNLARQNGLNTSDLLLMSFDSGFTAAAFLSPGKSYTLGREGDIQWLPYGTFHLEKGWTPFEANNSVSRRQLAISPTENGVLITSISESSATEIESAGIRKASVK